MSTLGNNTVQRSDRTGSFAICLKDVKYLNMKQKNYPFTSDKYTGKEFMTVGDLKKILEFSDDTALVTIQHKGTFTKVQIGDVEGFNTYIKDEKNTDDYLLEDEITDKHNVQKVFILSPCFL